MEYQALYRKYRPHQFDEVVGQGHVTETLAREVTEGRVAHAYLFAGPRGTGKTTTARILAKALNCTDRADSGEPCDACDSCQGVANGTSMDVIELDAASHNKVEDIRDIRVSVSTVASVGGAKRVFILDEAHMLTKAAGNALLKTLEEPPEHVHFVLATTEPYKLLDTIRSRSQRFDFHMVGIDTLTAHLSDISAREGYTADPGALTSVARHAGGSVRDAMSLLEQVAALGGGTVEEAGVRRALGLAGRDAYLRLSEAIAGSDAAAALTMVAELASAGVDLRNFIGDAVAFFRGVFLTRYAPDVKEVVDEPDDVLGDWRSAADLLQPADVLRAIDVLSEGLIRLREGREERLMLELSLLKLTRPEVAGDDPATLASRLDKLEQKINRMGAGPATTQTAPVRSAPAQTAPAQSPSVQSAPGEEGQPPASAPVDDGAPADNRPSVVDDPTAPMTSPAPEPPPAVPPEDTAPAPEPPVAAAGGEVAAGDLERIWPQLVAGVRNELGARREAVLREAMPGGASGDTLYFDVPAHMGFHLEQLRSDPRLAEYLTAKAGELLGAHVRVEFRAGGGSSSGGSPGAPAGPVQATPAGADSTDAGGGSGGGGPTASRSRSEEAAELEPEPIPDKDRMMEAPEGGDDPLALLADELGAEIVDDA